MGLGKLDVNQGQITLQGGTSCKYSDMECFDVIHGATFWDSPLEGLSCEENSVFQLLYTGPATKIIYYTHTEPEEYLFVKAGDIEFSLKLINKLVVCVQHRYTIEHPKLVIAELTDVSVGPKKTFGEPVTAAGLNIITYVNAKFIHVYRNIETSRSALQGIQKSQFELEYRVLQNLQTLAMLSPENFPYEYFKEPGYTAIRGVVIHLAKCIPQNVYYRLTDQICYNELTITTNRCS